MSYPTTGNQLASEAASVQTDAADADAAGTDKAQLQAELEGLQKQLNDALAAAKADAQALQAKAELEAAQAKLQAKEDAAE
ncbi:MAG: hypothetical protein O3A77_01080, partial [bacterium]|nr:hypothetical protein [bacterium]